MNRAVPLVAIPARFAASTSALRYGAVVTARALSESVLRAGGEPVMVHPWAPDGNVDPYAVGRRLAFADAVLLPGGGDLSPTRYGETVASDHVYDVDDEQDAFDLAVATWAIAAGVPLLAVCRGMQVVNVALGGSLEQHMDEPHRHFVHDVQVAAGSALAGVVGQSPRVSCYHHQRVDVVGEGLQVVARGGDGGIEALALPSASAWFMAVQWHPEDMAATDATQQALFDGLVEAGRGKTL
ncbi:MAG: type 1 glutamine amidotransferase [Actinomycetes bacterium]